MYQTMDSPNICNHWFIRWQTFSIFNRLQSFGFQPPNFIKSCNKMCNIYSLPPVTTGLLPDPPPSLFTKIQVDKIKSHIAKLQNYKVKLNEKYCTVLQIFGHQHGSQYHMWLLVKTARLGRNSGGNRSFTYCKKTG